MNRLMTGARPTGGLHLGQYYAAFKPFAESPLTDASYFIVSDLHMLTTKFTPDSTKGLPVAVRRLVAEAIGFGVDPRKTTFYLQSHVQWQARIYAIIQSLAEVSQLEAQPSFLEMSRHSLTTRPPTLGLLGYPILESSDVISIGATHVTIGENNRQHFALMTRILDELKHGWGYEFLTPKVIIGCANLIGLDGTEKMSKSLGNAIFLGDDLDEITRKVSRMAILGVDGRVVPIEYLRVLGVTDERCHTLEQSLRTDLILPKAIRDEIIERIWHLIRPIGMRAKEVSNEPFYVDDLLLKGCELADELGRAAYKNLAKAVGLSTLMSR